MTILTRYFCRELLKLFSLCLSIFLLIYLTIDFIQKIDNFIEVDAAASAVLGYFVYKVPYILVQMVPVATLISVVILFSLLRKNNEITALKASGMSVSRLSIPVLLVAACLSAAVFLFSELVVPYCSSKSQGIWYMDVKKRDPKRFHGKGQIWYKGKNAIYWIKRFDEKKRVMEDPTFYFFDDTFRLLRRIQCRRAVWAGTTWRLESGMVQAGDNAGGYRLSRFDRMDLRLSEGPEAFMRSLKRPEEMSYWQLKRFAEGVRREGYSPTRYLVDMNIKLAFPLVSLIMALIGIPLTLGLRAGGTPLAVCAGIGVCFLYLLILGLARSLGLSGILPPHLAAWLSNIVFFLFGTYLMMHLET